ncbi:hypothetical protein MVEN_01380100 [Mycena venus]|uniref:Uncharacterized protein n=1 Tax=Mycena venus TaxID=2733690 RepID=A0A8H6XYB7_9AGAR|nr:hypothetical protein MVEN_01380100 [Mycena venus]
MGKAVSSRIFFAWQVVSALRVGGFLDQSAPPPDQATARRLCCSPTVSFCALLLSRIRFISSQRPMSRSPPPPNPSIVNAGNLLPSVNVLFDEVRQRERASSHSSSGSRTPSAWSGFPGPDRGFMRHANPGLSRAPLPPLQVGPRPAPQTPLPLPRPATDQRYIAHSESPPEVHAQAPLPVIPNRMGGRYAQTPCHSNGQPHAPGLMPPTYPNQASPARQRARASTTASARHPPTTSPRDAANEASARIFYRLMDAAGSPSCPQCVHDLKIESRRQVAGTHGPAFSHFAHGLKPQHPTPLPQVHGLITIPFTPKPINNQTVLYGVSLTEILDFRDVLEDPRERVLDNSMNKILLTIEHPGFPVVVKQISGNCPHRPISRFNLAFSVAEAYFSYFKSNQFNPAIVTPGSAVVRSVTQLRLVNLYTTDRTNYRAHLAYVF